VAVGARSRSIPGHQGRQGHQGHQGHRAQADARHASSDHPSDHPSDLASRRGCRVGHPNRHDWSYQRARRGYRRSRRARRYPDHPRRGVDNATHRVTNDPIRLNRHRASPPGPDAGHHPYVCFVETAPDPGDHHRPNGLCPFPSVSHAGCRARRLLATALIGEHIQRPRVILTLLRTQPSVSYSAIGSTTL
jgi:hypothetical protein